MSNARPLADIADEIQKLERKRIFEIGDLLLEAQSQCPRGEWMAWLQEFGWTWNTADRYAGVAALATKFPNLKNLAVPVTVLYDLLGHDDDILPAIIKELDKHARSKRPAARVKRLSFRDAERIIAIGIGRHRFGDYPDATLAGLVGVEGSPWSDEATTVLKECKPQSDEEADALIEAVEQKYSAREAEGTEEDDEQGSDAESEAEATLDGPPPDVPPTAPSGPLSLTAGGSWPEEASFADAVGVLLGLCAKSPVRFIGRRSVEELTKAAEFLGAVANSTRAEAVAPDDLRSILN